MGGTRTRLRTCRSRASPLVSILSGRCQFREPVRRLVGQADHRLGVHCPVQPLRTGHDRGPLPLVNWGSGFLWGAVAPSVAPRRRGEPASCPLLSRDVVQPLELLAGHAAHMLRGRPVIVDVGAALRPRNLRSAAGPRTTLGIVTHLVFPRSSHLPLPSTAMTMPVWQWCIIVECAVRLTAHWRE